MDDAVLNNFLPAIDRCWWWLRRNVKMQISNW